MHASDIPSPLIQSFAKTGLGARAFVYLAVSGLLVLAALTPRQDNGVDPGDAFKAIEQGLGGRVLLFALGIGLFLYALWRYSQTVFDTDHQGTSPKGLLARLGMASSGTSYAGVGFAALGVAFDTDDPGGGKTAETAKWLMGQPFGRWLVVLGGLILLGIGCAQVWRVWSAQWKQQLDMSGWARRIIPLIEFGIAGRGLLFALVGGFLAFAGLTADASDVKGLASTLGWLRVKPFGFWLFLVASLAIGAYGVYSAVQSLRYNQPEG